MANGDSKSRQGAKNAKFKKYLPAISRRILLAAIKRYGSQRQAAKHLRLPNHGQVSRMLSGDIGETPAMRSARLRYETKALRVYNMELEVNQQPFLCDRETVLKLVVEMDEIMQVLRSCLGSKRIRKE